MDTHLAKNSQILLNSKTRKHSRQRQRRHFSPTTTNFAACDLITCISKFCLAEWQNISNKCGRSSNPHSIYQIVCTSRHSKIIPCPELVIISRLNIFNLAWHIITFCRKNTSQCTFCDVLKIVKHNTYGSSQPSVSYPKGVLPLLLFL